MIRTLVAVVITAVGSLYLPTTPAFDSDSPVEVHVQMSAHGEAEAVERAWESAQARAEAACGEKGRDGATLRVGVEEVRWVPGAYQADLVASGFCGF